MRRSARCCRRGTQSHAALLARLGDEMGIALAQKWIKHEPARKLSARFKAVAGEATDRVVLSALAAEIDAMPGLADDYRRSLVTTLRGIAVAR